MTELYFGNPDASTVLIQMVDDHDLGMIENEIKHLQALSGRDFYLIAVKVDHWNDDLSPWKSPAVFGERDFGEGAAETLNYLLTDILPGAGEKDCFLGGYSLAGLFALWAAFQTDRIKGTAAVSPSVWFPGFVDYIQENRIYARKIYLSLGNREEKTRHPVMAQVGTAIRRTYDILKERVEDCILEWNPGNHFHEPDLRMAKAFAWIMRDQSTGVHYETN